MIQKRSRCAAQIGSRIARLVPSAQYTIREEALPAPLIALIAPRIMNFSLCLCAYVCGVTNGRAQKRVWNSSLLMCQMETLNAPSLPEQMRGHETKKLLNRKVNWNYLRDMRAACMDFQSKLSDRQSFYSANMQTRPDNKQPTAISLVFICESLLLVQMLAKNAKFS